MASGFGAPNRRRAGSPILTRLVGAVGPVRILRTVGLVGFAVATALLLGACGGEEEPELTFEDLLVELEGKPLTPAQVAERAEVGDTVCLLDDRILDELWQQLSEDQLDFQDIVIAELCPDRAILYAGHTGRFVTEEAEASGVQTSTTRPTSTTSTRRTTTTRQVTTAATGTSSGESSGSTTATTTGSTTTTTSVTTTTSTTVESG